MLTCRVYENVAFNVLPFPLARRSDAPVDDRIYDYPMLDGRIHGTVNIASRHGRPLAEIEVKHGRAHGCARTFGPDGEALEVIRFREGRLYGCFTPFDFDGTCLPAEILDALLRLELLDLHEHDRPSAA